MEQVSARVAALAPSATMAMNQASRELKEKGIDVINLTVGEPDFFTPDHIKESAKKAIDENNSFYPPAAGIAELRKAVSAKFKRENNLDFTPEQIVVSAGAKNSLANAMLALINKDDEVIVPSPYWVTYTELVTLCEGKNIIIRGTYENNFKVTPDQIEEVITPKTKAILLCSPSNPSGSVYSKAELAAIVKVLEKHPHVFIISDEIYEHINFTGKHESIAQFDSVKERCIIINGVSKAYAMTGYRIGYLGAPLWLSKAIIKLQGQLLTGPTTMMQVCATTALNADQACVKDMLAAFTRRKDLIIDLIREIPNVEVQVPEGAFYVFPRMTHFYGKSFNGKVINNSDDLCLYLLEEGHIGTVSGDAFGEPDCIRISFATSDDNIVEAMKRMKNALAKLS
ncbi:MAG: pyridoxal phosphate-dependent aminotransferase [Bacteroidales bacterium]|nr:pyridoxal phosphate-dependent aminotransferase [Bacteroidales bacterium]MBN2821211.1 pyridoxal phosphate-dependent aminotransferase [Bacteroidales bacterium]